MAILVTCKCGQAFQTKDENAGRAARCPDCGRDLTVPKAPSRPQAGAVNIGTVTSGKAVTSVFLGLCSFVCLLFSGVPAIVIGFLALSEINQSRGSLRGKGLAVLGIVTGAFGFLVSLVLVVPAVQSARESARQAQCSNRLKEIGLALHNYENQRGGFPPAAITDKEGHALLSWRVAVLPYLGPQGASLFERFHLKEPWDSPHNLTLLPFMPQVYSCPSDPISPGNLTGYQAIVGPRTMLSGAKGVKIAGVTDGTSDTLMVVEAKKRVPWTAPDDLLVGNGLPLLGAGGRHPGGFHALFGDGSVHFFKRTIAPATFQALTTRDGGEVINGPY